MANDETTTNQPTETLATFKVSDSFDGDFEVKVNSELALPATTNERTFVVRVRNDEIESEWTDARDAMFRALKLTGWDRL